MLMQEAAIAGAVPGPVLKDEGASFVAGRIFQSLPLDPNANQKIQSQLIPRPVTGSGGSGRQTMPARHSQLAVGYSGILQGDDA
jgi:hypothetical protein